MAWMADFETTDTDEGVRVWCWYACEIGNMINCRKGIDIESFISFLQDDKIDQIYFHNLKFDGQFIVDYMLKNNYNTSIDRKLKVKTINPLIADDGSWYQILICWSYDFHIKKFNKCEILDSLKLLNAPVRALSKSFGLKESKGEIDYSIKREIGYQPTILEWDYVRLDVEIVAQCLQAMFDDNCNKMTAGACALANFKDSIGGEREFRKWFPLIPQHVDDFIRKSYRGGFTYVNPKECNKLQNNGIVLDVNSMYPWAMKYKMLPVGNPRYFVGDPDFNEELFVSRFILHKAKLKKDHIPTLQIKNSYKYCETQYLTEIEEEEITLTNVDLKLMIDHYDVNIEYIDGYYFTAKKGLFDKHIDHFMEVKKTTKGAKRAIAKMMLNSLYGKFGTNPSRGRKIPQLIDGKVNYSEVEFSVTKSVYIPVAVFVTAWARDNIIRNAQAVYDRFIYCDTDSLHLKGNDIPNGINVDPVELGAYKLESSFTEAYFIRAKTYCERIDGKLEVKCAGMPQAVTSQVTIDNFRIGSVYDGKLLPKTVNGGCKLYEHEFTIR